MNHEAAYPDLRAATLRDYHVADSRVSREPEETPYIRLFDDDTSRSMIRPSPQKKDPGFPDTYIAVTTYVVWPQISDLFDAVRRPGHTMSSSRPVAVRKALPRA